MFAVCMCIIYCTYCMNIPGLVLDHLAVLIPAHLDPGGQAAGQLLEQGRGGGDSSPPSAWWIPNLSGEVMIWSLFSLTAMMDQTFSITIKIWLPSQSIKEQGRAMETVMVWQGATSCRYLLNHGWPSRAQLVSLSTAMSSYSHVYARRYSSSPLGQIQK
jgi:hypothetical protein